MAQLESQRHLFNIPLEVAYFNCAYNSPLLIEAGSVLVEGALSKCQPWQRKPNDFFEDAETFRELASRALGGNSECYAVIPSASYGTSTVARIFEEKLGRGDEIIVLEKAFPSNYLPWQKLGQVTGAELVVVEAPGDFNWTQAVLDRITPRTKLVAIPNCHWTNGALL
ncbi:MAG: aminotransferase class V-fold PLP-dependent enzyme, partial [SAR324 cluster bacterium]|nr:aminotransferase class V-fold PLP-dependent enzyme [SAR324 cluster bacterium]